MRARIAAFALIVAVALAWIGVLDRVASRELDGAFKRSFATFAVARSLNGAISLVQDADVSVSPAGIGLTVSPGELLDPLNDLLEQFSTLAFTALTALGIQKFALQLSDSLLLNLVLSAAASLWLVAQFWPRAAMWQPLAARALTFALALRFLVPGFALVRQRDREFQQLVAAFLADLDLDRVGVDVDVFLDALPAVRAQHRQVVRRRAGRVPARR
jgi:hypothetical protein